MTVAKLGTVGTVAVRGGQWEPYINTERARAGEIPARSLFAVADQLAAKSEAQPNVTLDRAGNAAAQPDARAAREAVSSAAKVQDLAGRVTTRPYVLDGEQWDALPSDKQLEAVAAYAADNRCSTDAVTAIGRALRDGEFAIVGNGLEATLAKWCAGEASSVGPPSSTTTAEDPATAMAVESGQWLSWSKPRKLDLVKRFVAQSGCDLESATSGSYTEFVSYIDSQMRAASLPGRTAVGLAESLCGFDP